MKIQLKEWAITSKRLMGKVYNHPNPRHPDGKNIVTSEIIGKRKGLIVTHSGSEYELLDVKSDYEQLYPGAKERFMKSLREV